MNTHSRWADCRMEILCAHAALCGAGQETARALMGSATTDAGLDILAEAGLLDRTMDSLLSALQAHLERRAGRPAAAAAYCSPIPGACWG